MNCSFPDLCDNECFSSADSFRAAETPESERLNWNCSHPMFKLYRSIRTAS